MNRRRRSRWQEMDERERRLYLEAMGLKSTLGAAGRPPAHAASDFGRSPPYSPASILVHGISATPAMARLDSARSD
jgi:hypothetical protein